MSTLREQAKEENLREEDGRREQAEKVKGRGREGASHGRGPLSGATEMSGKSQRLQSTGFAVKKKVLEVD